jgi:hypothetical protein
VEWPNCNALFDGDPLLAFPRRSWLSITSDFLRDSIHTGIDPALVGLQALRAGHIRRRVIQEEAEEVAADLFPVTPMSDWSLYRRCLLMQSESRVELRIRGKFAAKFD